MTEQPSLLRINIADCPKGFLRFATPEQFNPGLKGYLLECYGVLLPVRVHRSQYPCLSIFRENNSCQESDLQATFVILSICVFRPGSPVFGWIDWRAQSQESTVKNTDFASSDGCDEDKMQACLRIIRRGFLPWMRRGRRKRSGYFQSEADFRDTMITLIRQCVAASITPTEEHVATYLARLPRFAPRSVAQIHRQSDSTERLMRQYCSTYSISWGELVRLALLPE